jgi:hypothetical protein
MSFFLVSLAPVCCVVCLYLPSPFQPRGGTSLPYLGFTPSEGLERRFACLYKVSQLLVHSKYSRRLPESICDQEDIITANIRSVKLSSPDVSPFPSPFYVPSTSSSSSSACPSPLSLSIVSAANLNPSPGPLSLPSPSLSATQDTAPIHYVDDSNPQLRWLQSQIAQEPQYQGWDMERAVADYWSRIRDQQKHYESVKAEEGPFIKVMNVGERIEVNRIEGE